MGPRCEIRKCAAEDHPRIFDLYPRAFPEEDLLPIVSKLLAIGHRVLSLVAEADHGVVAHVAFSECTVGETKKTCALLGPLAVDPDYQKKGIGSALIHSGLTQLQMESISTVLVLGDPGYYGKFGFVPEKGILPPYELPNEWAGAWQSLRIEVEASELVGRLNVPEPWLNKSLWLP